MSFTTIIFIASLGLLRMPHSLVITHTKPANALVPKDHVSASTASTAGQLMLPEDIVFYGNLILVALMIAGLYSFILGHEKSSRARSIPPLPRETYDYLTTKDQVASEFVRPDSRIRGPSKPAVQVQGIPTYLEKLAHSPTEEHTSHVFGASTSAPTQNAESRGRMDAVAKSSTADRSVPVSSAQSAIPKDRAGGATIRLSSRKKTYTRRVHTAPCATIAEYAPRLSEPEKPENVLLGSLRGFQLRPAMPDQNTLAYVLAVGLSWRHIQKKALPGPEHDLCWLKNFFIDQKRVQFTSLLDNEVSFDTIHRSVTRIYSDAQPNDCLVLYFTGHGDDKNAFELYDDDPGSLDEVILNDWIVKLRRETSKTIPVYIIFDFCRETPASSSARLDNGVTVFWSCPPGQKSPDMMLSKDLPYSCFLLALFLAIDDSSKFHGPPTVQYFVFARRLVELLNVIWGTRSFRPGSWRRKRWCRHPNSCKMCRDKRHNSRDGVGWPDPQSFEALSNMHLGELPDFSLIARHASTHLPLPIHKIRELLEDNQWFLYFNPSRINTNKGSSTPGTRKFRSRRVQDTIESTVQGRGRTLPLGALPAVPIPISK